jgi:hypothetical protein
MQRPKILFFLSFILILFISCGSAPETEAPLPEAPAPPPAEASETSAEIPSPAPPAEEAVFDPAAISKERKETTKVDVQKFIKDLNNIIRNKNFNAWKAALSGEYLEKISSETYLKQISEQPALKRQNIALKTPEDYFTFVVVPSRANDRVDDIDFISENRVKAYTLQTKQDGIVQRLRLYDLEHIGNTWKIIN